MLLYSTFQIVFKFVTQGRRKLDQIKCHCGLVSQYFKTAQNIILIHLKIYIVIGPSAYH